MFSLMLKCKSHLFFQNLHHIIFTLIYFTFTHKYLILSEIFEESDGVKL